VVWLELVVHPTALLAFQAPPPSGRLVPARKRASLAFFTRAEWLQIALVGGLVTALTSAGFVRSLGEGDVAHGRAMALVVLSVASAGVAAALSGLRTGASRAIAAGTLALAVLLVQSAPLAARLHLRPLHLDEWAIAFAGGALACLPVLLEALARATRERRA
jgi:Ca2+-transporting ATPase